MCNNNNKNNIEKVRLGIIGILFVCTRERNGYYEITHWCV